MENECEALSGVAYPGVRDNRSTINTKTGYDDEYDDVQNFVGKFLKLTGVINCQIFGTENHNFQHCNTCVILPINN